ncbi:hypothetical protein KYY02_17420 [Streptomyces pimonensis]|uniref:Uncharacterized protein n=1 Tax=Streptomyces pimonensis TaxID=2860288 RepID=A0ABV4J304_9ACTN
MGPLDHAAPGRRILVLSYTMAGAGPRRTVRALAATGLRSRERLLREVIQELRARG